MSSYRYTAFISYRHKLPDEAVAKKLHSLIENYTIPADVKKRSGRKKMGRVFRDQDELPLSTDLGNDIRAALDNSEYLIVLCSPSYPESRWCMAEIDYFISIGRRDHILTLLVDGEPSEAFPKQLCFIETEEGTVPVEPLAGDVRAETLSGSLKKLNREKLRVLAPMLGVPYDTLRQRERRRKTKVAAALATAAVALLAGFLTYALIKNKEIRAQNEEISRQRDEIAAEHMQTLIEQAGTSVTTGNKIPAKQLLSEAAELRQEIGDSNDGPLYSALESAVYTASFETVQTIDNDNRIFSSIVFSHDDRYLLGITNLNSAALIDAKNGKLLYTVSRSDVGQLDSVGFTLDDKYFYTVDSWYGYVSLYETATGEPYHQFNANNGSAWNIGQEVFAMTDHRILVTMRQNLCIWDYEADTGEDMLVTGGGLDSYIQPFMVDLSPDGMKIAVGSPGYGVGLKVRALDGSHDVELENDSQRGYFPIRFSGDGKTVAASSMSLYFVWDAETGALILQGTANVSSYGTTEVRLNYDGSVLVIMESEYLAAISVPDGETLWERTTESNTVTSAVISPNGKYVAASGGIEGVFDIRTGEALSEMPCTAFSNDGTKVLTGTYSTAPALLCTPEYATAKIVESYDGELFTTPRYTPTSSFLMLSLKHNPGEYYTTFPGNVNRKTAVYISPDTHYAASTAADGFIEVFDVSDPDNPVDAYCIAEHCYNSVEDVVFNGSLMASVGGYDPRCAIFDLESGTMLHVLRGERYAHKAEFSEDGSKIMLLSGAGKNLVFVYSVQTANLLYRFEAPEGCSFTEIGFSSDGKQAVARLSDGRAMVGEVYTTLEEMIERTAE